MKKIWFKQYKVSYGIGNTTTTNSRDIAEKVAKEKKGKIRFSPFGF